MSFNWFAFGGLVIPMIYLYFIGWAHKNLIDTHRFDLIATLLCVGAMIACVIAGVPNYEAWQCENLRKHFKDLNLENSKNKRQTYEPR